MRTTTATTIGDEKDLVELSSRVSRLPQRDIVSFVLTCERQREAARELSQTRPAPGSERRRHRKARKQRGRPTTAGAPLNDSNEGVATPSAHALRDQPRRRVARKERAASSRQGAFANSARPAFLSATFPSFRLALQWAARSCAPIGHPRRHRLPRLRRPPWSWRQTVNYSGTASRVAPNSFHELVDLFMSSYSTLSMGRPPDRERGREMPLFVVKP